ncbi:MAG: tyrosine-type recombinase/integrase [Alphaproteobacteria bacterium]|nr:tyrosine-type recombinase/integrase [Alphaproteobacteria bacterium]
MQELSIKIENYLTVCKDLKGLSSLTLKAYRIDLKQFNKFMQHKDCLSKECMIEYIDVLHKQYKPKSAKRKTACVKAFYHYMEMENIIVLNPFNKIKIKYKEPIVLPKTIPIPNIESIIKYAYQQHYSAITSYQTEITLRNLLVIELLFSTGMRVSEVSNLKISNIDLKSKNINIYGKGSKERIMCLTNDCIAKLLEQYLDIRNNNSEFFFINKLGNPYSDQSIRNMINSYAKAAGVEIHITPHMFRHTFATALLDEDVNIRYIQQLLGHSSIVTTQIYTHISTNKIRHILEDKHPRNRFNI